MCINIIYIYSLTGALLQKINRDTQKCAFKCSYACIDGKDVSWDRHQCPNIHTLLAGQCV